MNQHIVIYIILSAILLYLYYKKRDIAVFAAFIIVVGSTLIFGDRTAEGFGGGGGGGGGDKVDSECAKIGYTAPKIDKKDIRGSLEKAMKNVKTVGDKYVNFDGNQTAPKKEYKDAIKFIASSEIVKAELENINNNKETRMNVENFGFLTAALIQPYILKPSVEGQGEFIKEIDQFNKKNDKGFSTFTMILKGGPIMLGILNKIKKSDEMKEADKEVKTILEVSICSVKQFNSLWKNIQKAHPSGGDDEGEKKKDDGEEEDGGQDKKKKKSTKKKSKKDEDAEDDE